MEALSILLAPYKDAIGKTASGVTFLQMLSGAVMCNDIRKKKSTVNSSAIPFLGGIVMSILTFKLGAILKDDNIVQINFIGLALNIIYMTIFYMYTKGRERTIVWLQMGAAGAVSIAILVYAEWEDQDKIEFRLGLILTVFLFSLVASPFLNLREIIETQSTEKLPFPMIASGTVVGFMWFLYAICLNNTLMVMQNAVLLVLSVIQLSLFVIYPSKPGQAAAKMSKKKRTAKKSN